MKNNKWPDFLFTLTVRFVCGSVLGAGASLLIGWRGILRSFSHNHIQVGIIWLGLGALVGGIVAVLTIPRWQTPWYKRDSAVWDPDAGLNSLATGLVQPGPGGVRESVSIKTVAPDGQEHWYTSMDDVPPEIRSQIQAVEKELAQEGGQQLSVTENVQTGNARLFKTVFRKDLSIYKIVDNSGVERIYHSLEEMPPELRAAIAEAERKPET